MKIELTNNHQLTLKNDLECKITADGWEIFPATVQKYGIDASMIISVDGNPIQADWGSLGSILVVIGE